MPRKAIALADGPRQLDQVSDDRAGGRQRTRTATVKHNASGQVTFDLDRIEHPVYFGQDPVERNECRMDAHLELRCLSFCYGQQLYRIAQLSRVAKVPS